MKRSIAAILALAHCVTAAAQNPNLPDFGSPSDSVLSKSQEAQIGRGVVAQLRNAGAILEDPLVTEYIQTLGAQLTAHANDGDQSFQFFMVDDDAINAFALPGGFIGVNAGLILASETESEVAGVLAHEVAHVTQRHITRSIYDRQRTGILSMGAMIAAALLGVATDTGGEAMGGLLMGSQAAAMQRQINFTRTNEHEADRVGIGTLSSAGFDPLGMASFFEKLSRRYGSRGPAMLQTHPVTTDRIAEARARARLLPTVEADNSLSYQVIRARLEVLGAPPNDTAYTTFRERLANGSTDVGNFYGSALALSRMGLDDDAERQFAELIRTYPGVIAFRIGEADSMLRNQRTEAALQRYAEAIELSPRNVPLTTSYADALIQGGRPSEAHDLLLDLLNNTLPTPEQFRMIARAANAEGDIGNAHHYMSHYYSMVGNPSDALHQIQLALESPGVNTVDRARFNSELAAFNASLPE